MFLPSTENIPTRASLVEALKNRGDDTSWKQFYDTYNKLIFGVATQAGLTRTEAEDAVQETMFSVSKKISEFHYDPAIGSFKSWLLKLTRWRIMDQQRKRHIIFNSTALPEDPSTNVCGHPPLIDPASPQLDELWDVEWGKNLTEAALTRVKRHLEPAKYQIYDCYVNKGLPAVKVAKAFKISVDQVYLAKHRITELLRVEIENIEAGRV